MGSRSHHLTGIRLCNCTGLKVMHETNSRPTVTADMARVMITARRHPDPDGNWKEDARQYTARSTTPARAWTYCPGDDRAQPAQKISPASLTTLYDVAPTVTTTTPAPPPSPLVTARLLALQRSFSSR